ncbi:serine/threonine protein kinase [Cohnella sp. OV330]|uniref:serine/threonine-protein kinase n=1 Tax=Cohnella sp. OV330 TaxID=1855288 RepID=UPI0008E1B5E3|nr:serine/threonine-protein kinase [Cohnella sp. OV330]SFA91950.1 serine/threonine protein kinase [Cohnella sp. OV330]
MDHVIKLKQQWRLGRQIGEGGFGHVFLAESETGVPAAIKLIPKQPGAQRELLFEDLSGVRNIIPIIEAGEHNNDLVIVMPRADKSLRDLLKEKGALSIHETVEILTDIANALSDLKLKVVHRDLKPENVLLLDGHWCLSDFGIARYAEASTSSDTHKYAWSKPYNAPERWRFERATSSSDVYSFGVMAFELITGERPFNGPDFREQHLNQEPPKITGQPPLFTSLVAECLMKAPQVRPTADNLLNRLKNIIRPSSSGASLLQAANLAQSQQLANQSAAMSAAQDEEKRNKEIVASAGKILSLFVEQLSQAVYENAPSATIKQLQDLRLYSWTATLGSASLDVGAIHEVKKNPWGPRYPSNIKVMAQSSISIRIPADKYGYQGREHSLWFCDAQKEGEFGWFETAFMYNPVIGKKGHRDPFSLPPGEESGKALSPVFAEYQVAWPFTRLELGNEQEFMDRWLTWFALAIQGQLTFPTTMPERPSQGTWRK